MNIFLPPFSQLKARFVARTFLLGAVVCGAAFVPQRPAQAQQVRPTQEPPQLSIEVGRDVAPGPKIQLNINTRNLEKVNLSAYRLNGISWFIRRDAEDGGANKPEVSGTPASQWTTDMRPANEKKQPYQIDVYRSRQINLPALVPGIYLIEAQGGGQETWSVVNITDLAIITKRSPKRLLTWVTDFKTGAPVAGARVALWNRSGEMAANATGSVAGVTGKDGTSMLLTPPGSNQVLIVTRGKDNAGVPIGVDNPDGKLTMHFQTDRPIYRPGQKASFKSILRLTKGRGWEPLSNVDCAVQVRDARDIVIFEQTLTTNGIGTIEGSVNLPEEGSLGQYTVTIAPSRGGETQYGSFSVAAYRKPEFQVTLVPHAKRYLSGEKVAFDLQASYYFGAAVPGATVHYIVRRGDLPFYGDDDGSGYWYGGDGNLYDRDTYSQNDVVADATADLDATGKMSIEVPSADEGSDSTYSITATVIDGSRRQVDAASSVPVYRAAKRLSVQGEVSYVPVGYLMPLRIRAADLDGKPTGGQATLVLKKPVYNIKEGRDRFVEVTRTTVLIPASGMAKATLPAQTEGSLVVEVTMPDGTGRSAFASWTFWAAGPMTQWQREDKQPTLTLKPDRKMYAPGDTAKVLVATNVTDHPVLAVEEGLDIWSYTVIPAGQRNFVWKVNTTLEMSPNAYIGAAQWTKNGMISDNTVLPIPDPSRKLRVTISADRKEYRPGQTAHYTLHTTDDAGHGIAAEVAVSIVDEALYAVRPDSTTDLYGLFWAMRPNVVLTATSAPEELSGGAYQRVNKMASVRKQFLDTAFWNARVQTDKTGSATFTVNIPGNLTTWRATARAITGDTRVGVATDSVVATRLVTLRLATPRQMVQGDELTLIGSVNNRTKQDRDFETAISAEGLQISGPKTQIVKATAGGEGKAQWPLVAKTLPPSGEVKIIGRTLDVKATSAQSEELSDALETGVKVVPNGILQRLLNGGTLENSRDIDVTLPSGHIEPATTGILSIRGGIGQVASALGNEIIHNERYTAPIAAARLQVAALASTDVQPDETRENIALLARYQTGAGGWGWWEDSTPDAINTALVLSTLARAKADGIDVPEALVQRGSGGARNLYDGTQLWEHRALLASAISLADKDTGAALLDEVLRRAENLSPYARLTLAQALLAVGRSSEASRITHDALKEAVVGPETAFLRVGERPGWTANTVDATAAGLSALVELKEDGELQSKLARWLADPEGDGYYSLETQVNRMRALSEYDKVHPSATQRGKVTVSLNGKPVSVPIVNEDMPLDIPLPRGLWQDGKNSVSVQRDGGGEVFYALETRVYIPSALEYGNGVRVFRRYDVQNEGKAWGELKREVRPGEPVRCTVVVWPGERADALRVVEPLPAGFEYIEEDENYGEQGFSEVRDAAVVHYVNGNGLPITFRYFMRAESEGSVTALPATAEVLRRPAERGNSDAQRLVIKAAPSEVK